MKVNYKKGIYLIALMGTPELSVSAMAQTGAAHDLEEVVVNAQRREERLQDVPVSVTAFTNTDLEKAQITDIRSLQTSVPNVTFSGGIMGNSEVIIGMRGVSAPSFNPNADTAVGFYVDGVYFARSAGTNLAFIDMDQVEVLRGPQGTLFGRNTIAGAINITTKKPTDVFEGSLKVGVGNYDRRDTTLVVNVPVISDRLDVRAVYDHQEHSGYGYNNFLHVDLSDQKQDYFRLSAKFKFTDDIDFLLSGEHLDSRANPALWVVRYYDPAIAALPANNKTAVAPYLCTSGCRSSSTDWNPKNIGKVDGIMGTLTANLDYATFKSISAYRDNDFKGGADVDGTPLRLVGSTYSNKQRQFSEELQLNGKALDDRLDWIGGLYYFKESLSNPALVGTTVVVPVIIANTFYGENSSKSAFAQVDFSVTPELKLTAGARYVSDTRQAGYHSVVFNPPSGYDGGTIGPVLNPVTGATVLPACRLPSAGVQPPVDFANCTFYPPSIREHYIPWTLGMTYQPTHDTLYYGKVSQGFRSGGFQLANGSTSAFQYQPFGEEQVRSYEIGTKLELFDHHLRLNGAVFYTHYTDIQQNIPVFNPVVGAASPIFVNAGTEDVQGFELEATGQIGDLRLTGSYGYSDPRFKSAPYNTLNTVAENPVLVTKQTWSVAADYALPMNRVKANFHLDYGHQSRNYDYTPANVNVTPFGQLTAGQIDSLSTAPFGLLNGAISLDLPDSNINVTLWGRNLSNTYYYFRSLSTYTQGYNAGAPGDPRTFGVSMKYEF